MTATKYITVDIDARKHRHPRHHPGTIIGAVCCQIAMLKPKECLVVNSLVDKLGNTSKTLIRPLVYRIQRDETVGYGWQLSTSLDEEGRVLIFRWA